MRDAVAKHMCDGKFRQPHRLSGPIYVDDGFFRQIFVDDGIFCRPFVVLLSHAWVAFVTAFKKQLNFKCF
jgi:hypothetical protein